MEFGRSLDDPVEYFFSSLGGLCFRPLTVTLWHVIVATFEAAKQEQTMRIHVTRLYACMGKTHDPQSVVI